MKQIKCAKERIRHLLEVSFGGEGDQLADPVLLQGIVLALQHNDQIVFLGRMEHNELIPAWADAYPEKLKRQTEFKSIYTNKQITIEAHVFYLDRSGHVFELILVSVELVNGSFG